MSKKKKKVDNSFYLWANFISSGLWFSYINVSFHNNSVTLEREPQQFHCYQQALGDGGEDECTFWKDSHVMNYLHDWLIA